jgi:hypothetical protein
LRQVCKRSRTSVPDIAVELARRKTSDWLVRPSRWPHGIDRCCAVL